MKYISGFIFAFVLIYFLARFQAKYNILQENTIKPIKYSQSHIHSLVSPLLPKGIKIKKPKKTQSRIHEEKNNIKVIIMDNKVQLDKMLFIIDKLREGTLDDSGSTGQ